MVDFEYSVIRSSRRRTAAIRVFSNNRVTVTVPYSISELQIEAIVEKKSDWIRMRLESNLGKEPLFRPRHYETGEYFPYLGKNYRLEVREGLSMHVSVQDDSMIIWVPSELDNEARRAAAASQLSKWYRLRAREKLEEYVKSYSIKVGAQPKRISVKDLKSRWGSCSSRGGISFNWRIVMAPLEIIEYLVVHEMCHLVHHNHSPNFWALVASFVPDFRARKDWLRRNGVSLEI